jgi:hypothetical protein
MFNDFKNLTFKNTKNKLNKLKDIFDRLSLSSLEERLNNISILLDVEHTKILNASNITNKHKEDDPNFNNPNHNNPNWPDNSNPNWPNPPVNPRDNPPQPPSPPTYPPEPPPPPPATAPSGLYISSYSMTTFPIWIPPGTLYEFEVKGYLVGTYAIPNGWAYGGWMPETHDPDFYNHVNGGSFNLVLFYVTVKNGGTSLSTEDDFYFYLHSQWYKPWFMGEPSGWIVSGWYGSQGSISPLLPGQEVTYIFPTMIRRETGAPVDPYNEMFYAVAGFASDLPTSINLAQGSVGATLEYYHSILY